MTEAHIVSFPQRTPAEKIIDALEGAIHGTPPHFDSPTLMSELGLTEDQIDGRSLESRLTTGRSGRPKLDLLEKLYSQVAHVIILTNEFDANPAQEGLAQLLGQVLVRQIEREGLNSISPDTVDLATGSLRRDVLPDYIYCALYGMQLAQQQKYDAAADARTPSISPPILTLVEQPTDPHPGTNP